jgi:hypothetical protein
MNYGTCTECMFTLRGEAGVLENSRADGADQLLVHLALEPAHVVAHARLAQASETEPTSFL